MLEVASDGAEHSLKEARDVLTAKMKLAEADLSEMLPSGTQTKFYNRVAWAKSFLVQALVLETTRRGYFRITERGRELLKQGHDRIDSRILKQYPEFVAFQSAKGEQSVDPGQVETETLETPEETFQRAYLQMRGELAAEILQRVKANTPEFFERLVVDVMVSLGYGGSRADAGKSIGQSGDEGIDGIIKEDRLGLDVIYLQAKRWDGTVGRPEIQKFVGALHGKRAKKGVFITTGRFSDDAVKYVETIDPKVILIDGNKLADLMIDSGLGTNMAAQYAIRRIDSDYFTEE